MKAVFQIEIPDEDLRKEELSVREILDETLEAISLHYQMNHRFYFDIGYNPNIITKGGRN